jgi:hypothetical protein
MKAINKVRLCLGLFLEKLGDGNHIRFTVIQ